MKKTFFSISLLISLASPLAAQTVGGSLTINGSINGFEGQYIHMVFQDGDAIKDDSTKIENGKFSFSSQLDTPMAIRSLLIGDINDYKNRKMCYIYAEPKPMTIAIDKDNFMEPKVTGSLSQAQMDSITAMQRAKRDEITRLREEEKKLTDKAQKDSIDKMIDACEETITAELISWIKAHPSSYIVPFQMRFMMSNMTYSEIESIYNNFTPEVKAMPDCDDIVAEMKILKTIQPGQPAPLFRAKNWKGVEEGIADLKGKYVILDFWATWCVPCRKSFPHVKSLYEKYKSKGLDVFCIADDDNNETKWKAAIEKDGIQDFHHVLRGLVWDRSKGMDGMDKTNDISDKYAIHYLPTKYLIDDKGYIVGKFNDEELDAKLKEIFGF